MNSRRPKSLTGSTQTAGSPRRSWHRPLHSTPHCTCTARPDSCLDRSRPPLSDPRGSYRCTDSRSSRQHTRGTRHLSSGRDGCPGCSCRSHQLGTVHGHCRCSPPPLGTQSDKSSRPSRHCTHRQLTRSSLRHMRHGRCSPEGTPRGIQHRHIQLGTMCTPSQSSAQTAHSKSIHMLPAPALSHTCRGHCRSYHLHGGKPVHMPHPRIRYRRCTALFLSGRPRMSLCPHTAVLPRLGMAWNTQLRSTPLHTHHTTILPTTQSRHCPCSCSRHCHTHRPCRSRVHCRPRSQTQTRGIQPCTWGQSSSPGTLHTPLPAKTQPQGRGRMCRSRYPGSGRGRGHDRCSCRSWIPGMSAGTASHSTQGHSQCSS